MEVYEFWPLEWRAARDLILFALAGAAQTGVEHPREWVRQGEKKKKNCYGNMDVLLRVFETFMDGEHY